MQRFEIINKIGDKYHVGNLENGEFSYPKALKSIGINIKDYQMGQSGKNHDYLDIRFENERLVVLVETKKLVQQMGYKKNSKTITGICSLRKSLYK